MEVDSSDDDYVIKMAKDNFTSDPYSAKAWMITAKTLYPNNFFVQFEAYVLEKNAKHVKEAAKFFSDLIGKFQNHPELWKEIENVTDALRGNSDGTDADKQFLCDMFKHIQPEIQHKLLLCTADHCEDTMEHCRLLLLLLQKFPATIPTYGPRLIDTLLSAEKHSSDSTLSLNVYRKLLICELLPLLSEADVGIDIQPKILYKLLHKSIEFYSCHLNFSFGILQENEPKVEQPWQKLFAIVEYIGKQLEWDQYLVNLTHNWSKESYWQRIVNYCQNKREDEKPLLFCTCIFFLHCLHEYVFNLAPDCSSGQPQIAYVLIDAFLDASLPPPPADLKIKKRKTDECLYPYITVEKSEHKYISSNFLMAINCWDLIHSSENFQREFSGLSAYLKLEPWLTFFITDYTIYKGRYDDAFVFFQKFTEPNILLNKYVRIVSILYSRKNFTACFENILQAVPLLTSTPIGQLSSNLVIGGNQRHLHFLPLTHTAVLQYFVKVLMRVIKENMLKHSYKEMAIGHILTLVQFDWPQEEDVVPPLMTQIQQQGSFSYALFQNYIINVDILEEIIYLWTNQGGQINLDIIPHLGQRRIGTRGADKGAKEEIKQIIKRQVARCNENLNELLTHFIMQERGHILQTLV